MTKYQVEFYKFVIAPENFEAICDIVENFEDVRLRLVYDFWVDVKDRCEVLLKEKAEWTAEISPYNEEVTEFLFYRSGFLPESVKEDADFCIYFMDLYDRAYYGLWLNEDSKSFNMQSIRKIAKDNKLSGWRGDGTTFAYYKFMPDNFDDMASIKKIQPDNRESLVHQYADNIIDGINELEPFINKHILKYK